MKNQNTALDHFMHWIPDERLPNYRFTQHGACMIGAADLNALNRLIGGILETAATMKATNPRLAFQIDLLVRAFQSESEVFPDPVRHEIAFALLYSFKYAGMLCEYPQTASSLDGEAVIDLVILRHSDCFERFQDCFTQDAPPSINWMEDRTPVETRAVAS